MTTILGIDPGLTGALAWLNYDGTLAAVADMPALDHEVSAALLMNDDRLTTDYVSVAVLEWPGIMPKNGAKSARSIGMSLATMTTFLAMRCIPTQRVTPAVWKRSLGLSADKSKSRALAIRLWPDRAQDFARVKDSDRAEAALLAYWWLTKSAQHAVAREVGG